MPGMTQCASLVSIKILSKSYSIQDNNFSGCTSLEEIDLSGCTFLGSSAFIGCHSLKKVIFPPQDIRLASSWIFRDTGLEVINIPNNILEIGMSFCYDCKKMKKVRIGTRIDRIGDTAFLDCRLMEDVTILASIPPILGNKVFDNTNNCPIYVPAASIDAYKSAPGWSNYASRIQPIID